MRNPFMDLRTLCSLLAASSLLTGGMAQAAPVATNIVITVTIQGLGPISFSSAGSVSVTGSSVSIAAGAVSLPAPVVVPVTATTAVASLTAMTISNQAGTFSVGGVTAQAPTEICGGGPAAGTACNTGGGVGGAMGVSGTINVHIIPNITVIPVDLNLALLGQGGATSVPFTIDAALFSTGAGLVNTGANIASTAGSPGPLTLVTPTFLQALGNVLPIFTSITFTNVSLPVPEPSPWLLIGAGALGIAFFGLRRS